MESNNKNMKKTWKTCFYYLLFIIYIFVLLRIVLDNKHNRNLFTYSF
jgi:hypothetical protein